MENHIESVCRGVDRKGREVDEDVILTILDELLLAVGNVKIALGTAIEDVTRLVPAIFGESLFVEFRSLPVAREDVWSLQEKFSGLDYH